MNFVLRLFVELIPFKLTVTEISTEHHFSLLSYFSVYVTHTCNWCGKY